MINWPLKIGLMDNEDPHTSLSSDREALNRSAPPFVSSSWLLRQHSLRRRRGVRGSANHQHGTRSLSDHMFCPTAQKHVGTSRPPMCPPDNHIHPLLVRSVHNHLRGCALDKEGLSLEPSMLDPR